MRKIMMVMGIFLYCLIKLNINTVMADFSYDSEDTLELYGESALLMDANTGEILYEKNGDAIRAIASTTKILTCLIAIEEANLDEVVTISEHAAAQPDVQMNAAKGEQYTLGDLLIGMMLESYNDVSVAVAEHIAGSTEAFADKMNERAKKIGCKNSYFITPNGLDAQINGKENTSTAYDLALILAEAIKNKTFLSITQTPSYTIREIEEKRIVNAYNRNAFLHSYEGMLSGKTGFTGNAGYCYAGAVNRDERTFVAVTLGSGWPPHKTNKWKDMNTLFDYGFDTFHYRSLQLKEGIEKKTYLIKNAKRNYYKEEVYLDVPIPLEDTKRLLKEGDKYYGHLIMEKELEAPLKKNEKIGELRIFKNGKLIETREVQVPYVVEKQDFWLNFHQILCYIFDRICRKSIEIT